MKLTMNVIILIFSLFVFSSCKGQKGDNNYEKDLAHAEDLFKQAKFESALELLKQLYDENHESSEVNYRIGYIYLLSSKYELAEKHLEKSLELKPRDENTIRCLAEVNYKTGNFIEASSLYAELGNNGKSKQLAAFNDVKPYKLISNSNETHVEFLCVDPLPRFYIKVNGKKVAVQLDTGGSELILDREFAREIGAEIFGSTDGMFGGGRKSVIEYAKVDSIQMGEFKIKNVPIHTLQIGSNSFKGIVGTNVLYQFIATIDYLNEQIVLKKKNSENELWDNFTKIIKIPFWLEGDHFILARGTANKSDSLLFLVDTGLADGAFMFPVSTADKIGMEIDKNNVGRLHGGGGMFELYHAELDEMTISSAIQNNLRGIIVEDFGLANKYGYRIDGIISHEFFKNYSVTFDFERMIIILAN